MGFISDYSRRIAAGLSLFKLVSDENKDLKNAFGYALS